MNGVEAVLLGVGIAVVTWLPFAGLTSLGARRRGQVRTLAVLSGALFPVTWVVWYLRDERRAEPDNVTCADRS
ncbi:hypothetical protein ERC79_07255 [Rhodococcus sp. ABRD24]|uniref:hypothetical protein n=1 Tax=Rhodococcus sp. ABRD24 TaxID=2507582 RepID=UPI00103F080A|nr:hypothetical protein [Rhodococcus sp. ABRD24]QBJ95782.1 hypothetical protein ERC79_07255 [Rhodococcus sp. ABRD24]